VNETDLIERLAVALSKQLTPLVPLSVRLWSAEAIAAYLQRSTAVVRERIVTLPNFPQPIRLPAATSPASAKAAKAGGPGRSQPLWKAAEIIAWAESYRDQRVGRPRKRLIE
jgi:hypothetical protein